ncbi:MAG: hypothetical protein HKN16_05820 [Saprospiraceae bacterium]|nr:hypothetical protein [Saprospiraceae bacterium]
MKKFFLFLTLLLALQINTEAQVGISIGQVYYDATKWDEAIRDLDNLAESTTYFKSDGIQFAIDYWFRLKNFRVEFFPEVSYYNLSARPESLVFPDYGYVADLKSNVFQFNGNVHIYPFDLEGDCDCPTFSKDGSFLQKGFFIRAAPGIAFASYKEEITNTTIAGENSTERKEQATKPTLRIGAGIDFGVNDFITITPLFQYTYGFDTGGFEFLSLPEVTTSLESEITQTYFGVRLGLRFDEINKYGYR